uniref:TraB family protein n=1 Tax=Populus trichocarpa TaxID=3694 RepID=A0A3N7FE84_POPTR
MKTRYVKRMTRSLLTQLSSPHSHRFFSSTTTTKSPLRHHQTTLISTRPTYSPPKFLRITTFATKNESIFDAADELREDNNKHDVASERKEPLHEFSRNVVVLTCESKAEGGQCVVYLVGTAHVSQASCREVEAVIRHVKPQVVFLELCASRVGLLTIRNLKVPTMKEMIEKWKKTQNAPQIFLSWFYATVGDKLGVVPGSEFQVAFEEARKCEAKVVLGDRPAQVLASLIVWLAFHCANLRAALPHPDIYCHPSKVSVTLYFGLRHFEWINLLDLSNLYCWTASSTLILE